MGVSRVSTGGLLSCVVWVCHVCLQVGCCHALWMLSESYSVMHYAGVWGCSRPAAAASMKASMTASTRKLGRTHRQMLHLWLFGLLFMMLLHGWVLHRQLM